MVTNAGGAGMILMCFLFIEVTSSSSLFCGYSFLENYQLFA